MDRGNPQRCPRTLQLPRSHRFSEATPMQRLQRRRNDQVKAMPNRLLSAVTESVHPRISPSANPTVTIGENPRTRVNI